MMQQIFCDKILQQGYRQINEDTGNTKVFVKGEGKDCRVVISFDVPENQYLTEAIVQQTRVKIAGQFFAAGMQIQMPVCLIWTQHPEREKQIAAKLQSVWLIDTRKGQLILYENQKEEIPGLQTMIEECLGQACEERLASRRTAGQWKQKIREQGWCNITIIAINILVFLVLSVMGSTTDTEFMLHHGALYVPDMIENHHYYELGTAMFLHFGFWHILNNMLVLFILGGNLERAVRPWKYLLIYVGSGLAGNILSVCVELRGGDYAVSAGASGAIMGVMGALIYILIRNRGRLENLHSRQLYLMAACTLYYGFVGMNVNNMAHIGGLIGGFLMAVLLYGRKEMVI